MHFWQVILKNVWRRKLRSLLTGLGVSLAMTTLIALVGFASGLEQSTAEVYAGHRVDLVVSRAGVTERLTSSLPQSLAGRLAQLPGVAAINPSLTDIVSFGEGSLVGIPVQGWPADSFAIDDLIISHGRRIRAGDMRGILLGDSLAAVIGKQVGQQVQVELEPFQVIGTFAG